MTKRKLNKQDILQLASQIEELSVPTRRDEEHATIAHYVNLLLSRFGKEGAMLVGSTSERMRVRTEQNEADSDFILICGKTVIPIESLEYNKDCPCFASIKGKELLRYFKVDLIDGVYIPADLLRNVDANAFSLLRIIHKALTRTVHAVGEHTPRDMIPRKAKVGTEFKEYFGGEIEFVDTIPPSTHPSTDGTGKETERTGRDIQETGRKFVGDDVPSNSGTSKMVIIKYKSFTSKDYVPCFRLSDPPRGLYDWIVRKRLWPNRDVVDAIADGEYFVVAKPALVNPRPEIDFCLSFSSAEKKLFDEIYNVPIQRKCYLVIKAIHRAELKHPQILKTFHWKTAFFWISENCTSWTDDVFSTRVVEVLKFMEKCLENRELPHYFVESNLFADLKMKGQNPEVDQIIQKLKHIQSDLTVSLRKFLNLAETGEYDVISADDARLAQRAKRMKADNVGGSRIKEILLDTWKELSELKRFSKETYNDNSLYSLKNILKAIVDVAQQVVDDGYIRKHFLTRLKKPLLSDKELGQIGIAIKGLRVVLFFVSIFTSWWFVIACVSLSGYWCFS